MEHREAERERIAEVDRPYHRHRRRVSRGVYRKSCSGASEGLAGITALIKPRLKSLQIQESCQH